VPVHPTQLYEALALVPVALLLFRWRRERRSDPFVLGAYLLLAGAVRFAIEFIRVNEHVAGPLSVAHVAALAAMAGGALLLTRPGLSPPPRPARNRR
jgi:phosphatidylglycerol---prolipoprotein diacylglyceryl transferase